MTRTQYLFRSVKKIASPKICPYCQSRESKVVDRKYLVTTLNECSECNLLFRHPLDSVAFNKKFYQKEYEQNDGITTDLPTDAEIGQYMKANFAGSGKDYRLKIDTIKNLVSPLPLNAIDYGANWGTPAISLPKQVSGFNLMKFQNPGQTLVKSSDWKYLQTKPI